MQAEGRLLDVNLADIHGQHKFNFEHGSISRDESKQFLDEAFQRDFELNGPSLFRICRTILEGWRRHRDHPDERVREGFAREVGMLRSSWAAILCHGAAATRVQPERQPEDPGIARRYSPRVRGHECTADKRDGWAVDALGGEDGTAAAQ
jgi:hypothetical protein